MIIYLFAFEKNDFFCNKLCGSFNRICIGKTDYTTNSKKAKLLLFFLACGTSVLRKTKLNRHLLLKPSQTSRHYSKPMFSKEMLVLWMVDFYRRLFEMHEVGNFGIKDLRRSKQTKISKLLPLRAELRTSVIPVWRSALWANLPDASWGVFNNWLQLNYNQ